VGTRNLAPEPGAIGTPDGVFDMKRTRTNVWIPACSLAVLLSACGGKKEAPKPSTGGAPAATPAPTPASAPAKVQVHIEVYRMGYALGSDGQVRGEGSAFGKGDKAFLSFGIRDAKPGSTVRVVWVKNPAGTKVNEETKALPPDPGTVSFVADTASWATGEYGVEIWVLEPSTEPRRLGAAGLTVSTSRPK
jgi:hypothetical protein